MQPRRHPIVITPTTRAMVIQLVSEAEDGERIQFVGKQRSLPQNSFSHSWYAEIAKALPEDDALGWKCYCKLHHGVPILRAEDEEFRIAYDTAIKGLSYEQKLGVMKILPVTSRMNKEQMTKYANAVRDYFLPLGVVLVVKGSDDVPGWVKP